MKNLSILLCAVAVSACSKPAETADAANSAIAEPSVRAKPVAATPASASEATSSEANAQAETIEKMAKCAISKAGYDDDGNPTKGDSYKGPCLFTSEKGGHFIVRRPGNQPFWTGEDRVTTISVGVDGDNAQVSGMTADTLTRWGFAKRLASDRACWSGDEFTVCAY